MPDRRPEDGPREHDPLPEDYAGPERRKPDGIETRLHRSLPAVTASAATAAAVATHAAAHANEPEWWRKMPTPYKAFVQLGLLGLFVVLFGVYFWDNRAALHRAESERRADRVEEREIRRAEMAQTARQADALADKFDALISKVDASISRVASAGDEVRTSRVTVEQIGRKLEDLLVKLFAELKRLVPAAKPKPKHDPDDVLNWTADKLRQLPMFGAWDAVAPQRMPELLPEPREVVR